LILFLGQWGNTWSDKMINQKRIGLEGTIKAYAGQLFLDHAAKLGSTNLQIIRAVSLR
jgi:hypothetical protein